MATTQFEIHYEGDLPDLLGSVNPAYGGGQDGKTICLTLEKFVHHGGALKTLRLSFDIYRKESSWDDSCGARYYEKVEADSPWCKRTQIAVTLLTIESKTEVVVNSEREDDGPRFEDLPNLIADCKRWKFTNLSKETVTTKTKREDEDDSNHSSSVQFLHRTSRPETIQLWTWTLAPTTTRIGEDDSQAVESPISKEDWTKRSFPRDLRCMRPS